MGVGLIAALMKTPYSDCELRIAECGFGMNFVGV
jgi:hypothetical protein